MICPLCLVLCLRLLRAETKTKDARGNCAISIAAPEKESNPPLNNATRIGFRGLWEKRYWLFSACRTAPRRLTNLIRQMSSVKNSSRSTRAPLTSERFQTFGRRTGIVRFIMRRQLRIFRVGFRPTLGENRSARYVANATSNQSDKRGDSVLPNESAIRSSLT